MGTSMGCMHAWVWGEHYPDFVDGLVPLACAPTQIAGRNRMIRTMIMDVIRDDPGYNGGDYTTQPRGSARRRWACLFIMTSAPKVQHRQAPTRDKADSSIRAYIDRGTPDARRERRDLPVRRVAHLRPVARPREDHGAGAGDQFGRRFREPAGARRSWSS